MKVLVVGALAAGRHHADVEWVGSSSEYPEVFALPGNPATVSLATNLAGDPARAEDIYEAVCRVRPDLVWIDSDRAVATGVADRIREKGVAVCGPSSDAALLETDKAFGVDIRKQAGVPGPETWSFQDDKYGTAKEKAFVFTENRTEMYVVKARGLADGKGVVVPSTREEMREAIVRIADAYPGGLILQKKLKGKELSVFAWTNGRRLSSLIPACDFKRLLDGDKGPNTGSMGSFSPPVWWNEDLKMQIGTITMEPIIRLMAQRGTPYQGPFYAGLMLEDIPQVIEFNARLGDPEAQVILPRMDCDSVELLTWCSELSDTAMDIKLTDTVCVGVVIAVKGYPETKLPEPVCVQELYAPPSFQEHSTIFWGNVFEEGGVLKSWGGRILTAVGFGKTIEEARVRAYERAECIVVQGGRQMRTDIGRI